MQGRKDAPLIYATLALAVMTAILSSSPVRRVMDGYLDTPPASVTMVVGNSVTEEPASPAAALDWHVPLGN